jgi:hypothetical protein
MCIDATRQFQILKGEIRLSKEEIVELLERKRRECESSLSNALRENIASGQRPDVKQLVWPK